MNQIGTHQNNSPTTCRAGLYIKKFSIQASSNNLQDYMIQIQTTSYLTSNYLQQVLSEPREEYLFLGQCDNLTTSPFGPLNVTITYNSILEG